jgi:hypothetical protein
LGAEGVDGIQGRDGEFAIQKEVAAQRGWDVHVSEERQRWCLGVWPLVCPMFLRDSLCPTDQQGCWHQNPGSFADEGRWASKK